MQDEDIPYGFCQCGCGEKTTIATVTMLSRGHVRGEPKRFVHGHGARKYWHVKAPLLENTMRQYVCGACGREFERPNKPGQPPKYCTPECAAEAGRLQTSQWYRANQSRVLARREGRKAAMKAYNAAYYQANREREIQRVLAYAAGAGKSAKAARDSARYALTRGSEVAERFTLDEIFERDAGICSLCGGAVERHGQHSLSATMDHVIPVTKGGPHTRANVKLAHRGCNTRKGNRMRPH